MMKDLPHSLLNDSDWPEASTLRAQSFETIPQHTILSSSNFLINAIQMSLFSDQRHEEEDSSELSRLGYWVDGLDAKGSSFGSKLWTLTSRRLNEELLEDAIQYAYEALLWLMQDEIVSDLHVDGKLEKHALILQISVNYLDKKQDYNLDLTQERYGFF